MVDRIGNGGSLAREAILAALRSQAKAAEQVQEAASRIDTGKAEKNEAAAGGEFAAKLNDGIASVSEQMQRTEELPMDFVTGKVESFHEVAVQLKQAEVSFRFAMEVRNKLIDAYREVMRMNV